MGARADDAAARIGAGPGDRAVPLPVDPGGGRSRAVDQGPGPAGPRDRRRRAHRSGRAPGAGLARHAGPVDPGVAPRRVRRAGARPAPVRARGCRSRWSRWRSRSSGRTPPAPRAQVRRILRAQMGWAPGERTLQRWFADDPQIADAGALAAGGPVRGRCSGGSRPSRPNELWTGDALHGPHVGGRKTYLFAFLDDHSRAIMGHRFGFAEDTVRLAAALRPALGVARGPGRDLRRQRLGVRRRLAAARLREARDPADPLHPGPPAGPRQDRAVLVRHEARCRIPGSAGRNSKGGSWV